MVDMGQGLPVGAERHLAHALDGPDRRPPLRPEGEGPAQIGGAPADRPIGHAEPWIVGRGEGRGEGLLGPIAADDVLERIDEAEVRHRKAVQTVDGVRRQPLPIGDIGGDRRVEGAHRRAVPRPTSAK
jgi:hypothetical protein